MDFGINLQLLGAEFSWFAVSSWLAIAKVVLGLGFVIFVHELGHFLVAKACGVKCEKFYVGFDFFDIKIGDRVIIPRSLLKWKWGETEYGIGIVPLGGYVKMLGQEDNPNKISDDRVDGNESADDTDQEQPVEAEPEQADTDQVGPVKRTEIDPRNYQAKSVLQRMAIISAGVIMNLIFAVIFATIAFCIGVPYQTTQIGNVQPGGPAYEEDLAGSYITQINGKDTTDTYYPFRNLVEETVMHGEREMSMMVQRRGNSQADEITITPKTGLLKGRLKNFAMIGLSASQTNQISSAKDAVQPGAAASKATVKIEPGDIFHKINGEEIHDGIELTRELSRNFDKELEVVLRRKISKKGEEDEFEEITTRIPTLPYMETGIIFETGPVITVQKNDSPAQKAGMKKGDFIKSINGQEIGDPFTLAQRMTRIARDDSVKTINIVVIRKEAGNDAEITLEIEPRLPRLNSAGNLQNIIACDPLGFAFEVKQTIKSIVPGSAAEGKLQAGDAISSVQFDLTKDQQKEYGDRILGVEKVMELDGEKGFWATIHTGPLQYIRPGPALKVTVDRNGSEQTVIITPQESSDMFLEIRGIALKPHEEVYVSKSYWEAFNLGLRQTGEDMLRIFKFLNKLITGELSITLLGGPGTIATVATMEASESTSRLLLFLTLLSANLAIVNFLPIPILDGGHMVFLAYEGIFRRPVNENMQRVLTMMGLLFIVALMLFVIGLDVTRIFGF